MKTAIRTVTLEPDSNCWGTMQGSVFFDIPAYKFLEIRLGMWLKSQKSGVSNNWRPQAGRSRQLRKRVMHALARLDAGIVLHGLQGPPTTIRFTRLAPRTLDDDNLRTAFKPIRDQVCCWLAGDNTLTAKANDSIRSGYAFHYSQQKQSAYAVVIEVSR